MCVDSLFELVNCIKTDAAEDYSRHTQCVCRNEKKKQKQKKMKCVNIDTSGYYACLCGEYKAKSPVSSPKNIKYLLTQTLTIDSLSLSLGRVNLFSQPISYSPCTIFYCSHFQTTAHTMEINISHYNVSAERRQW